jgi:hypothetical protein
MLARGRFLGCCAILFWAAVAGAQSCNLYPIALPASVVANAPVNSILPDVFQGVQPGNFGWLTWAGSPSVPTLVTSLTPPGDSGTYVNPDDAADHQVSVGDWVRGKPGVSNSKNVRDALDVLKQLDITVPVWNETRGQGANAEYRVSAFARVRLLSYHLPGQNRITARFLGYATCDQQNVAPVVHAGADQTIQLPAGVTLQGAASDDGLPTGSALAVAWTQQSGAGTVTFADPTVTNTTATFSAPGTYELRLTATDGVLNASDEVIVTVDRANTAPQAFGQSLDTDEDTPLPIVLQGQDAEMDPLSFVVVADPSHGALTGLPPNVTYTPAADFNGSDSFTFKVSDGLLESAPATAGITIRAVDDVPVADSLSVTNLEDTPGPITLSGADVEGSPLTFILLTAPSHGTLDAAPGPLATNRLEYTPAPNFHGTDSFTYKVNDGALDSLTATVTIHVVSVNDAPLVDAGADQFISLPGNSVALAGSVMDDVFDGALLTTTWTKASGPGAVVFADPAATNTTATFSASGVYVLRLTADDFFLVASDELVITVNAPPVVSAGTNQIVTFPAGVTLAGAASDDGLPTNGTLVVAWSKVSGLGAVVFADPSATNTSASFGAGGIYVLRLTANDGAASATNDVTVTVNRAPIVDAGSDQFLNELTTTLAGSVADDGLPEGVAAAPLWIQVSGPGDVTFGNASDPGTTATFSTNGVYVLRLLADDSLASTSDDVTITINGAPLVDAGADQTNRQDRTTFLQAALADDGYPVGATLTFQWSALGPGSVFFADRNATNTTATFSAPGVYVLTATVSDGLATSQDQVVITVTPPNTAPMVSAGQGQLVYLPAGATLNGAVQDDGIPAGALVTTTWSLVNGPGTVTFGNASATNTTVSFSAAGNYVLRLTADDTELTNAAQVTFAVRNPAANAAPNVNAGRDKTIGLTNVVTLCGAVSDDGLPQGAPLSIAWSVVSGPGAVTFDHASLTNSRASFNALGTYVLRLTASDSALSAFADVSLTVYPVNNPPVVHAGTDQTILVPDPALLSEDGSVSLTPQVELSVSLSSLARWNNAVGQPGLTGVPAGAGSTWVWRHGIALDGTNLYASGLFRLAGGQLVKGIARWDGAQWYPLFDPRTENSVRVPMRGGGS